MKNKLSSNEISWRRGGESNPRIKVLQTLSTISKPLLNQTANLENSTLGHLGATRGAGLIIDYHESETCIQWVVRVAGPGHTAILSPDQYADVLEGRRGRG